MNAHIAHAGLLLQESMLIDPSVLFLGGKQGVWYDPTDLTTMFQDAAGTIPVTAAGQPVGKMLDKSGNNNHWTQTTSSARPIFQQSGGLSYLVFDGVSDAGVTPNPVNMSTKTGVTVFTGFQRQRANTFEILIELGAIVSSPYPKSFHQSCFLDNPPGLATINTMEAGVTGVVSGTDGQNSYDGKFPAVNNYVYSSRIDLSTSPPGITFQQRFNGGNLGVGTYTNHVSNGAAGTYTTFSSNPVYIGNRANNAAPFKGFMYSAIFVEGIVTLATLRSIEAWIAKKSGVTLVG